MTVHQPAGLMAVIEVGDVVEDRDHEDRPRMIVVDPDRGPANEVYIEALEATVAEVNDRYSPDDPVIECVHQEWLERHASDHWTEWERGSFADRLEAFVDEWNIPLQTYHYPEGRLDPVAAEDQSRPTTARGQSSIDDWGT